MSKPKGPKTLKIEYSADDGRYTVSVEYLYKRMLKYTHIGKVYPIHTQAVLKVNGFVKAFSTITKHDADEENMKYAFFTVTKNVFNEYKPSKEIRIHIWDALENYFETLEE